LAALVIALASLWRTHGRLEDVRRRFDLYVYRMQRELQTDAALLTTSEMVRE